MSDTEQQKGKGWSLNRDTIVTAIAAPLVFGLLSWMVDMHTDLNVAQTKIRNESERSDKMAGLVTEHHQDIAMIKTYIENQFKDLSRDPYPGSMPK